MFAACEHVARSKTAVMTFLADPDRQAGCLLICFISVTAYMIILLMIGNSISTSRSDYITEDIRIQEKNTAEGPSGELKVSGKLKVSGTF